MSAPLSGIPIPAINLATGKLSPDVIPGDSPAVAQQIAAALSAYTPTGGGTGSTATPIYLFDYSQGRPVTPNPVVWANATQAVPSVAGSTVSGTGPAPIDTILYVTGVGV